MSEKADADLPFPMSVLTSDFQPAGIPFSGRVVIRVKGWRDVKQFPSIDWVFHREVKRPDLILWEFVLHENLTFDWHIW